MQYKAALLHNVLTLHTGLIGGGSYRGNRPLILALHQLLAPPQLHVCFHLAIFGSHSRLSVDTIVHAIQRRARQICTMITRDSVRTIDQLIQHLQQKWWMTSTDDADIMDYDTMNS